MKESVYMIEREVREREKDKQEVDWIGQCVMHIGNILAKNGGLSGKRLRQTDRKERKKISKRGKDRKSSRQTDRKKETHRDRKMDR